MTRAHYEYNTDEWQSLFDEEGLTVIDVAQHIGVSERHVYHILSGEVQFARFKTKKKIQEGLEKRGLTSDRTKKLFRQRSN